jgi:glycolate oxidase
MISPAFIRKLRTILPSYCLLVEREDVKPFETDGLTAYRSTPDVVCLPETEDQVKAIVNLCRENTVPIVARGAGTGVSGGALPVENGVPNLTAFWKSTRWRASHGCNPVCAISPFLKRLSLMACIMRPTPHRKSPAPLVAMWRRTRAVCIA